ncbi:MAG: branched-chain amino acid ABC transporter permease [Dongiaceae bacterium]
MDTVLQVVVSGLTLGAMYALSTIGLSLVWGSLNMLNMAQGVMLALGGYAAYAAVTALGLPAVLALPVAMLAGFLFGLLIYFAIVRFMLNDPAFETNVIIATVGVAIVLENLILKAFGAYPFSQPFQLPDGLRLGAVYVPYQNLLIIAVSLVLMAATAWLIGRTRMGRAIRATAQNRDGALLMGVPVRLVFAQVLALGGVLAAVSGVMLSSITTLAPTMGYDPMLKAFIICVIAGLGNTVGALIAAFGLGVLEAAVQFLLGVRFAFPVLLLLVIVALILRPEGIFTRRRAVRQ